jgi:hypothetical protein
MQGPSDAIRPSSRRRAADSFEDGLDRLVSAGRQLVDGVSGARPGSRRRSEGQPLPRLGELGRWVEQRLDGLLDGDDDDWREPWQEPRGRRRPLEAVSRRGRVAPGWEQQDWPDDDSFSLPRWQRDPRPAASAQAGRRPGGSPSAATGRPLPRSSRRHPDQTLGN